MGTENKYEELGPYAARLIRRKAGQIIKLEGFTPADREDIEQDLALEILRRKPSFDPKRGDYQKFVAQVIYHGVADIVDRHWAAMRNPRRCECSLNKLISDGEGGFIERTEVVDYETRGRRGALRSEEDIQDLRLDLEEAVQKLPPKLYRICELLREGKSLPEIARLTGIPQSTVYEAKDKIRAHFERAGLADHARESSGSSRRRSGK